MLPLLLMILGCAGPPPPPADPVPEPLARFISPDKPAVIAHRGGWALAPEETLVAYKNAVEAGADMLELDARVTADGVVVAMHDDLVDRTTDGVGAVAALTLAELKALDAGYRFTLDEGESFPWRGRGVEVPTLEEVLSTFPEQLFTVEIKQHEPPMVEAVLEVLRATDALDRVIIASVATETLEAVRTAPDAPATSLSGGEAARHFLLADDAEVPPARFIQVPPGFLFLDLMASERVARAERLGVGLQVWTITDREGADAAIEAGVHGIMTSDPVMLRALIDSP